MVLQNNGFMQGMVKIRQKGSQTYKNHYFGKFLSPQLY